MTWHARILQNAIRNGSYSLKKEKKLISFIVYAPEFARVLFLFVINAMCKMNKIYSLFTIFTPRLQRNHTARRHFIFIFQPATQLAKKTISNQIRGGT